jgi:hypothetical protein
MKLYNGKTELEILIEARDYISKPGNFVSGRRHCPDSGAVCAIGAIERALGYSWYGQEGWSAYEFFGEPGSAVLNSCARELFPESSGTFDHAFVSVNNYNGQEAIVKVFDCAIEKTKAKELVEA